MNHEISMARKLQWVDDKTKQNFITCLRIAIKKISPILLFHRRYGPNFIGSENNYLKNFILKDKITHIS